MSKNLGYTDNLPSEDARPQLALRIERRLVLRKPVSSILVDTSLEKAVREDLLADMRAKDDERFVKIIEPHETKPPQR